MTMTDKEIFKMIEEVVNVWKKGEKLTVIFPDGVACEAIPASDDFRMFQVWDEEANRWSSFSFYEFFKIFEGKVEGRFFGKKWGVA